MFRRARGDAADQPFVESPRGLRMPQLGMGTFRLEGRKGQKFIESALALGYRHIDTAQQYGNEAEVGAAVRAAGASDDAFVVTKIDRPETTADAVKRSLDESRRALGVDRIDLLLMHWPTDWDTMAERMAVLAQAKEAGLCAHVGVSNFSVGQLDAASDWAPIDVVQAECHPYFRNEVIRQWCADHDALFTAHRPLGKGASFGDPAVVAAARNAGVTPAQAVLAWLLQLPGVAAIPFTADKLHLRSNWEARSVTLAAADVTAIDAIDENIRTMDPKWAVWDGE